MNNIDSGMSLLKNFFLWEIELKMEEDAPLRQKRGETALLTVQSAPTTAARTRTMTFGTNSIDVSDIPGFL